MLLSLALGGRLAARTALVLLPAGLGVAVAIAAGVWRAREPLVYFIGGWAPPLGLALRADGLSAAMLLDNGDCHLRDGTICEGSLSHTGRSVRGTRPPGFLGSVDGGVGSL